MKHVLSQHRLQRKYHYCYDHGPQHLGRGFMLTFLEIDEQRFHLIADSHSYWMEVFPMKRTTTGATIATFKNLIAHYGLSHRIVTDNGSQHISEKFKSYLQQNGIRHTLSPPYHPSTNGQAEAYVKTFKRMFKKCTLLNYKKSGSCLDDLP